MARTLNSYCIRKHTWWDSGKHKESLRWNIFFKDHLQIEHRIAASPDKSTSKYIAQNIVDIVALKECNRPLTSELRKFIESQPNSLREKLCGWGILDANTNAGFEPLMIVSKIKAKNSKKEIYEVTGGHLLQWRKSLESNERSSHHVRESVAKVIRVIEKCKFLLPSDIKTERIETWMSDLRNAGKSANCINSYLESFKRFCRWLLKTERIMQNPVQFITKLKNLDKKRPRRVLTTAEIDKLISKTLVGKKHHGLTGYERSLVYRLALGTGLRYNEIYTLERRDFIFCKEPNVTIKATNAKNRKTDTLPLIPELAKDIEQYFKEHLALPHRKAFLIWKDAGAKMIRKDLEIAEIEYKTEEGIVDFHSLRHTFGTLLAKSGVLPQDAQKLMRHSDVNLTMNIYTHISLEDKAKAVSKLPEIKIVREEKAKTGTCDVPENFTANFNENAIKTHKNAAKSSEGEIHVNEGKKNITSCTAIDLRRKLEIRPTGFEPVTYGLEIRCSIQLSYGRKI